MVHHQRHAKTFIDRLSELLSYQKELGYQLLGKALSVLCSGADSELPVPFKASLEMTPKYLGTEYLGACYARVDDQAGLSGDAIAAVAAFAKVILSAAADPALKARAEA